MPVLTEAEVWSPCLSGASAREHLVPVSWVRIHLIQLRDSSWLCGLEACLTLKSLVESSPEEITVSKKN